MKFFASIFRPHRHKAAFSVFKDQTNLRSSIDFPLVETGLQQKEITALKLLWTPYTGPSGVHAEAASTPRGNFKLVALSCLRAQSSEGAAKQASLASIQCPAQQTREIYRIHRPCNITNESTSSSPNPQSLDLQLRFNLNMDTINSSTLENKASFFHSSLIPFIPGWISVLDLSFFMAQQPSTFAFVGAISLDSYYQINIRYFLASDYPLKVLEIITMKGVGQDA